MIDLDQLEALAKAAPAGKWEVWTSNSWRRVFADQGREKVRVIEPATQHDRWPDLMFGPGVAEWLEGFTPEVALALIAEVRALREDAARYRWLRQQHWNEADMFVVAGSKSQIRLGTDCPSLARLDVAIDAARKKELPCSAG